MSSKMLINYKKGIHDASFGGQDYTELQQGAYFLYALPEFLSDTHDVNAFGGEWFQNELDSVKGKHREQTGPRCMVLFRKRSRRFRIAGLKVFTGYRMGLATVKKPRVYCYGQSSTPDVHMYISSCHCLIPIY